MDAAATVIDPFSALVANGLGWAMEHFEPLREVLDELAGIPDLIVAHAETWNNVAGALQDMADDLHASLASDLPDWSGAAAEGYQSLMGNNVDGQGATRRLTMRFRAWSASTAGFSDDERPVPIVFRPAACDHLTTSRRRNSGDGAQSPFSFTQEPGPGQKSRIQD